MIHSTSVETRIGHAGVYDHRVDVAARAGEGRTTHAEVCGRAERRRLQARTCCCCCC